jgi:hypothetical protein
VARWIAAVGLTVVGLTAWFVIARGSGGSSPRDSSVGSGTADLMAQLTTGVCFNLSDTEFFAVVPCQHPHDNEAYYRDTFPPGPFPGDHVVQDGAVSTCDAHLEAYVGSGRAADFYDWPLAPDQSEWAAGNHFTICVLSSDYGKVAGSAHHAH